MLRRIFRRKPRQPRLYHAGPFIYCGVSHYHTYDDRGKLVDLHLAVTDERAANAFYAKGDLDRIRAAKDTP